MDRTQAYLQFFKDIPMNKNSFQVVKSSIPNYSENPQYRNCANEISRDMFRLNQILTECENNIEGNDAIRDEELKRLFNSIQNNIQTLIRIQGKNNEIANLQGQAHAHQYFLSQIAQRYQQYLKARDQQNYAMTKHLSETQSKLEFTPNDIESNQVAQAELVVTQERNQIAQNIQNQTLGIVQLFEQLHQIIASQDFIIQRIDSNTQSALDNTEEGTKQLNDYYNKIKGNRRLMIKIFLVLIVFVLAFITII